VATKCFINHNVKTFYDIFKYWQDITILNKTKIYKQEKSKLSEILLSQVE
jgi:hypothetical protein